MSQHDPYATLKVGQDANGDEIKRSYKRLAMRYHPDRNDQPGAESRFKEIQQAYAILSDPQKKQSYDLHGTADFSGFEGANGFQDFGANFSNLFDELFTNRSQYGQAGAQRAGQAGRDLNVSIELDLEEAVHGCSRKLKINSFINCNDCGGSGAKYASDVVKCPRCHGSGAVRRRIVGMMIRETCPQCSGGGKFVKNPCTACEGNGRVRERRTVDINVPAGVDHDDILRIAREGEAGKLGGPHGDLLTRISVREHPVFQRSGDNLTCEMPISFATAALGGMAEVPTLSGKQKVKLRKGMQSGKRIKLPGYGVCGVRTNRTGDLFCTVKVETPQDLNKEQADLMRNFDKALRKNPEKHSPNSTNWLNSVKKILSGGKA